ncbi:MAG: hypothetical protein QXJ62_04110 [Nitrososphaeria archaeon]
MIYAKVGLCAMKKKIREKLDAIRLMLRRGYSLRKAIETVKMGWGTYYRYKDYIYSDSSVPVREKRIADNVISFTRQIILWPVARSLARKYLMRKYKTIKFDWKLRKEAQELASALVERWTNEIFLELLAGY